MSYFLPKILIHSSAVISRLTSVSLHIKFFVGSIHVKSTAINSPSLNVVEIWFRTILVSSDGSVNNTIISDLGNRWIEFESKKEAYDKCNEICRFKE